MLTRVLKRTLVLLTSLLLLIASAALSHFFLYPDWIDAFWKSAPLLLSLDGVVMIALMVAMGLDNTEFKNAGFVETFKLITVCITIFIINLIDRLTLPVFPLRWVGLHFIFFTICLFVQFFAVRAIRHFGYFTLSKRAKDKNQVIIVGAGEAGTFLAHDMLTSETTNLYPACFVDDNPNKLNLRIHGIKVAGTVKDIPKLCEKFHAVEIAIAIPSAKPDRLKEILSVCQPTGCKVVTLPGQLLLMENKNVTLRQLRTVDVQDLLGREPIKVDMTEIQSHIRNKTVLVTGGGGSIGSELCRQIAGYRPAQLIVFDIYENNAYDLEQELHRSYPDLDLKVLIGSIRDKGKVEQIFEAYKPQVVFNAAAHKHVPLMENSPNEAIKNNVFGTLNVARAAEKYKAERFVQISTDKAVNPTNVMGATKRIGEMIIQTIGKRCKDTKFVAVRFGNVLGSNGSVIPLFKKQIAEGGPVTVTHKDIIRYFMTIPEAVSLVLQACCYANAGEIFVFDMGEPVKIYDLAQNLIRLSGYTPGKDIQIVCTGLRPGEKLYEERLMEEEGLKKTANDLISIGKPLDIDEDGLFDQLALLEKAVYEETHQGKELVQKLVPTYRIDKR